MTFVVCIRPLLMVCQRQVETWRFTGNQGHTSFNAVRVNDVIRGNAPWVMGFPSWHTSEAVRVYDVIRGNTPWVIGFPSWQYENTWLVFSVELFI